LKWAAADIDLERPTFANTRLQMIPLVLEAAVHAQARNDARRALVERDLQQQLSTISVSSSMAGTANGSRSLSEAPPLQPVDNTRQVDEALRVRLEAIGFRLGWSLSER
jgi:hypothetical protein